MSLNWKKSPLIALLALVGVTAIWGGTFLVVQDSVERMPVMDFLAARFTLATLVMLALRPSCVKNLRRIDWLRGVGLGVMMGLGYIFQTFGLKYTSASVSGFMTGTFVVLTPVVSWLLLRRPLGRNVIIAVLLATTGLALLSLKGWSVGLGEGLTLGCAFFFALHVVGLGEWSAGCDAYAFAMVQIGTTAVISLIFAFPGGLSLPPDAGVWGAVVLTAVFATALAFVVQTWSQSLVPATRAAIVMTMEPVFAGIFGVFVGGNQMTPRILAGAACVLLAMLIAETKSPIPEPRLEA